MKKAFRITTYAPPGDVDSIISSICSVWPVRYGKYENVFWLSPAGTEQFTPMLGSNPTQGMIGELETLESVAICFLIPRDDALLERVIEKGIRPAHRWEEPVIISEKCRVSTSELGDITK